MDFRAGRRPDRNCVVGTDDIPHHDKSQSETNCLMPTPCLPSSNTRLWATHLPVYCKEWRKGAVVVAVRKEDPEELTKAMMTQYN